MDIFLTGISFLVSSLTFGLVFKCLNVDHLLYIMFGKAIFLCFPHSHHLCQSFAIRRLLDTRF